MPADFLELTYRGQVGRLRSLARDALPRFGLPRSAPLKLCNHGENTVFQTADRRGKRYALRVHRTHYQTPRTITSEMQWLAALRRDTDIVVPKPRAGRDGEFIQRVSHEGVLGARCIVILEWVHGRFHGRNRGARYCRKVGELAGALHAHGRTWKRPSRFHRRAWNEHVLFGVEPGFGDPMIAPGLTNGDRELFVCGMNRMRTDLRQLGKGRSVWGLIHADLHRGNVLFSNGRGIPIDFDDCGPGWYAYELAVALNPVLDETFWERVSWFREGYERHVALDQRTLNALPCFCALRALSMVGWIADRSDNPSLATFVPRSIARARQQIGAYLNT